MSQFTFNIPTLKVLIRNSYLTSNKLDKEFTEGFLIAITCLDSRPLLFTVHLSSGALFSRLPINAIVCNRYAELDPASVKELNVAESQLYSCFGGNAQFIAFSHFKDYEVICKLGDKNEVRGRYLFTVDYDGFGLAEDPEQFKTHNIIVLNTGQLVALPNNHILFVDNYFATERNFPTNYKRQSQYYFGCP